MPVRPSEPVYGMQEATLPPGARRAVALMRRGLRLRVLGACFAFPTLRASRVHARLGIWCGKYADGRLGTRHVAAHEITVVNVDDGDAQFLALL